MTKVKFTLDRQTDRQTNRQTDRQGDSYIPPPPNFVCGGYNKVNSLTSIMFAWLFPYFLPSMTLTFNFLKSSVHTLIIPNTINVYNI